MLRLNFCFHRCFGVLLAQGRNVRACDMQLLDLVCHHFDCLAFVIVDFLFLFRNQWANPKIIDIIWFVEFGIHQLVDLKTWSILMKKHPKVVFNIQSKFSMRWKKKMTRWFLFFFFFISLSYFSLSLSLMLLLQIFKHMPPAISIVHIASFLL